MHSYSTSSSRLKIYAALAIPAVVSAWLIAVATSTLNWPQWLVTAPSVTVTYAAFYALFDRLLWKHPLARSLGLSDVSDVSGDYAGDLVSTFEDENNQRVTRDVKITIVQTWTGISISMAVTGERGTSTSGSSAASLTLNGSSVVLDYMYQNRVRPGVADSDMNDHSGAAQVVVANGSLTGRYFNSRPRAGSIDAKLVTGVIEA